MPTPTPIPVVITNSGTDWWAQLLDGLLGAVIAAVVGALVAVYVVQRQHRQERLTAREVVALEAAEVLTQAALDVYDLLPLHYDDPTSDLRAAHHWAGKWQLKQAALFGYVLDTEFLRFQAELIRHAEVTKSLVARNEALDFDERTGLYPGQEDLMAEHLASMDLVERQMKIVLQTLGTFRAHGRR